MGGIILLAACVSGIGLYRASGDRTPARLTIGWGGSEGRPSCVYDARDHRVDATITIDGRAPDHDEVVVTVSAYADENTSDLVGSRSRTVQVRGTVHLRVVVEIPVRKPPHVDIDGETACRLDVEK